MPEAQASRLSKSKPVMQGDLLELPDEQWILLVEDSVSDAMLIKLALENCSAQGQIQCVTDGEQAINLLRQLVSKGESELPDTIVLDLNLPRVDGYAILAHIRENSSLQGIAIFVYTSSESEKDRQRVLSGGADGFCTKPVDLAGYRNLAGAIQLARRRRLDRLQALRH